MSLPYHYPQFQYTTPYLVPFYQPVHVTPYIPSAALPPSPRPTQRVRFADDYSNDGPAQRQRRPSWHAGMAGMTPAPNPVPFPSPTMLPTQLPPVAPWPAHPPYVHQRRRSDSCLPQPTWVTIPTVIAPQPAVFFSSPYVYTSPLPVYQNLPPANRLHLLLNGEHASGPLLLFDLSLNTFSPLRIAHHGDTTGQPLSLVELEEPATLPGITRMTIKCDMVTQWPVVLEPERESSPYLSVQPESPQPITLGDVLVAIHRSLQTQIRHVDWARLTQSEEIDISRAYTRRCRTFSSARAFEASQGVRRVDYLKERYMFKGLVRTSGDGFENMKLITGTR